MLVVMVVLFLLGYTAIAMEHKININKAASALILCCLLWIVYIFAAPNLIGNSADFMTYASENSELSFKENIFNYVTNIQIIEHVGDVAEILFFLMGAMTIVELIDVHGGFSIITDHIKVSDKRKLLWKIAFITFFMSAVLDNLTTSIVMIMMLRKLISDQKDRWVYGSIIIIAANSGGAFSPIGDVTTIMLWVKGNISTGGIIPMLIIPAIVSVVIPTLFASRLLHPNAARISTTSQIAEETNNTQGPSIYITKFEQRCLFFLGVGSLVFVPIFKTLTHLPPFIGVLLGLSIIWFYTELMYHRKKDMPEESKATISKVLKRVDMTTILFFLGILMAVAALQCAGILGMLATTLDHVFDKNVYIINVIIGLLSSVVDNVPLVAGTMGMYDIAATGPYAIDGAFWLFLAYCAGVGGSILIIGSAAGVVVMGLEKITFGWYLKHISWFALLGYLCGAAIFIATEYLIH